MCNRPVSQYSGGAQNDGCGKCFMSRAPVDQRAFYSTAIATWTEISDGSVFTGITKAGKMEFMDGYSYHVWM